MPRKNPKDVELVLNLPEDTYFEYRSDVTVDKMGMKRINLEIMRATKNRDLPYNFDAVFEAPNKPRFTRRVSKHIADRYGIKLSPKTIETIGNIANKHTVRGNVMYAFTRNFDWRPGDFGDNQSCFWGDRRRAKTMIWDNGAYAIRLFDFKGNDPQTVKPNKFGIGRAWIMPAKVRNPSTKTMEYYPIIFNAYRKNGYNFEMRDFAVIMADYLTKLTGVEHTVKRINLTNGDQEYGVLYLNMNVYEDGNHQRDRSLANSGGFIVAPPSICEKMESYDFGINERDYRYQDDDEDDFYCELCDDWHNPHIYDEDDQYIDNRHYVVHLNGHSDSGYVCDDCFQAYVHTCSRCRAHATFHSDFGQTVLTIEGNEREWCPSCVDNHATSCSGCGMYFSTARRSSDGQTLAFLYDENSSDYYCPDCSESLRSCEHCGAVIDLSIVKEIDNLRVCEDCFEELYAMEPEDRVPDRSDLNMNTMRNPLDDAENTGFDEMMLGPVSIGLSAEDADRAMQEIALGFSTVMPNSIFYVNSPRLENELVERLRVPRDYFTNSEED